jgi:hypothetical protein
LIQRRAAKQYPPDGNGPPINADGVASRPECLLFQAAIRDPVLGAFDGSRDVIVGPGEVISELTSGQSGGTTQYSTVDSDIAVRPSSAAQ